MSSVSFLKNFPPPKFLDPRTAGILFSDRHVKAIVIDHTSEDKVLSHISVALKPGTIVSGAVVDKKELITSLKQVYSKVETEYASFAIPDELTYIFSTEVPVNPGKDAYSSIEFTIEENVPVPLADVVFDFTPLSIKKDDSGYKGEFLVVATSKSDLEDYVDAIKSAGFKIKKCLNESQAIVNAVIPKSAASVICVVHTKEDRVGMYLSIGGLVYFSTLRSVTDGGDYAGHILAEYDKLNEYWSGYGSEKRDPISSFIVCGDVNLAKIAKETLNSKTSLPSTVANVWSNIFSLNEYIPNVTYEESVGFPAAIGVCM